MSIGNKENSKNTPTSDLNLKTNYSDFDLILRPYLNMNTKYNYLSGSSLVKTNTKYHTSSRLFLYVKKGSITVKFACWKSRELFGPFIDYDKAKMRKIVLDKYNAI